VRGTDRLALIEAVGTLRIQEALQVRLGVATGAVVVGDLVGSWDAQKRGPARLAKIVEDQGDMVAARIC
jgi:hypothetical protein